MKTKKLAFYLLACLLGGCLPVMSLHPLYTEKNLTFDEKLLGTWVDDSSDTTWHFSDTNEVAWQFNDANKSKKPYKLIIRDKKSEVGSFIAHLVKLKNRLFLDVFFDDLPWDEKDPNNMKRPYNLFFLMPVHTFIKVNAIEPQLKLQLTDDDELTKLLEKKPKAVEHTLIEDRLFLTASTKKLQAFVLKYADDSRVFTEEVILTRKKTNEPNSIDPNHG